MKNIIYKYLHIEEHTCYFVKEKKISICTFVFQKSSIPKDFQRQLNAVFKKSFSFSENKAKLVAFIGIFIISLFTGPEYIKIWIAMKIIR